MKKAIFMAGAVLMSMVCFGQVKDVKKVQSLVLQELPDFNTARQLIEGAKMNAETKDMANTWYVAGLIGYQESTLENNKRYLNQQPDYNVMGAAEEESIKDWIKADELAGVLVQDKKGNMVMDKKNVAIRKNIASRMLEYWNNQGLLAYAVSFYENKDYARAFELYKMYISLPNMSVMQDEKIQAKMVRDTIYQDVCFSAGQLAYSSEKYQDAIDIFSVLVKGDYKAIGAGEYLYSCYLQLKDTTKANEVLDLCLQLFPNEPSFIQTRINTYVEKKDYDNAIRLLNQAIAQDKLVMYYNSKGSILTIQGKYDEAIATFKEGIAIDANNADLLTGYAYVFIEKGNKMNEEAAYMSDADYKKARKEIDATYKEALPLLEKAYELNKDNYDCVQALRNIYYRLGMMEEYNAMQ